MFCHKRSLCQTFHSHLKAKQYFSREVTGKQPSPLMQKNTNIIPRLNCLQGDPQMKESSQSIWVFSLPFCGNIFYMGSTGEKKKEKKKKKKKKQRKIKPALNEKFQSCLCQNPPSSNQLPLPLDPGLCVSLQRGEKAVEKHSPAVWRLTSDRAPWCPNLGEFKWQASLYK